VYPEKGMHYRFQIRNYAGETVHLPNFGIVSSHSISEHVGILDTNAVLDDLRFLERLGSDPVRWKGLSATFESLALEHIRQEMPAFRPPF